MLLIDHFPQHSCFNVILIVLEKPNPLHDLVCSRGYLRRYDEHSIDKRDLWKCDCWWNSRGPLGRWVDFVFLVGGLGIHGRT